MLAVLELDGSGGSARRYNYIGVILGAATGVQNPEYFTFPGLGDTDDGHEVEPAKTPAYVSTIEALTDGADSALYYGTVPGSTSGGMESASAFQFLASDPGAVDLVGWVIERIALECDTVSLDIPGRDPNGDGEYTDYSFTGRIAIYGRRPQ